MASVFDTGGAARLSLREIVRDYGAAALDDERLVTSILTDLLAGQPREATLIRAAARLRVAELLRAHAGNRIPVTTAIEDVTARLGHEASIEPNAARWIVSEYAVALGQLTPEGAIPAPAQGVAKVAVADPPPTVLDASPISDPRPVSGGPAAVPGARRPGDADPATEAPPTMAAPIRAAGARPPAGAPAPAVAAPVPAPQPSDAAAAPTPALATILAVVLPLALGVGLILSVPAVVNPETYADGLNDQWLMVLLPMTLTLFAVTAAARADVRAWAATIAYAAAVYLGTVAVPMIGDTDSGGRLFRDLNLAVLRQSMENGGTPNYLWLVVIAFALTALSHAVMKRLRLVRRVGLLAFLLPPAITLLANAVGVTGYHLVVEALRGESSVYITSHLVELAVLMNAACVAAIALARVPRFAGRR